MSREMKDSGVEWIGSIPKQSILLNTKFILEYVKGKNPSNINTDGKGMPYIGASDLEKDGRIHTYTNFCENEDLPTSEKNDVLVLWDGARAGLIGSGHEGYISSTIAKITPKVDYINKRFWWWYLKCMQPVLFDWVGGTTIPHMKREFIYQLKLVLFSRDEQTLIAEFLDIEVSNIDSIIEKTKSTIEDYRLLKQSIITDTVTKGLDKNKEMKDSGIEWIGEIPKHWVVNKLRYLGTLQNGISKGSDSFGTGTPFVSYSDIYKNYEVPSHVNGLVEATEKDMISYSVREGDVFFTRTSETVDEIGLTSTCFHTIPKATFAGFLIRFRPLTENILNKRYSKYYFRSDIHRRYFVKEMNLVTRASLSQGLLKNLTVLLPPFMEQQEIGEYLELKCGEIDLLIMQKTEMIKELVIYKNSLIYEYVTGKKKVK